MQTDASPVSTSPRFPNRAVQLIVAACILLIVAVRLVGRSADPPFPLDDPSIRNLVTLILAFLAGLTLWVWFCFLSGYPVAARRVGFLAPLAAAVLVGIVLGSVGLTRSVQFSGSMVPR